MTYSWRERFFRTCQTRTGGGHTVIGAKSANAALEILRRDNSIDLVITDQVMPQMTGLQLAQAIKQEWPELPVILATGFAELPPNSQPLARLSKPFTQADLVTSLISVQPKLGKGRVVKFGGAQS